MWLLKEMWTRFTLDERFPEWILFFITFHTVYFVVTWTYGAHWWYNDPWLGLN